MTIENVISREEAHRRYYRWIKDMEDDMDCLLFPDEDCRDDAKYNVLCWDLQLSSTDELCARITVKTGDDYMGLFIAYDEAFGTYSSYDPKSSGYYVLDVTLDEDFEQFLRGMCENI